MENPKFNRLKDARRLFYACFTCMNPYNDEHDPFGSKLGGAMCVGNFAAPLKVISIPSGHFPIQPSQLKNQP
jgi:hypothetical protein